MEHKIDSLNTISKMGAMELLNSGLGYQFLQEMKPRCEQHILALTEQEKEILDRVMLLQEKAGKIPSQVERLNKLIKLGGFFGAPTEEEWNANKLLKENQDCIERSQKRLLDVQTELEQYRYYLASLDRMSHLPQFQKDYEPSSVCEMTRRPF